MQKIKLSAFADEVGEDFELQLAALRRNGMHYVEIRSVDHENVSKISLQKAQELKQRMDDAGVACQVIGSPVGKTALDRASEHEELLRHIADIAHVLGADKVRMFSYFMQPYETDQNESRVVDALCRLQEIAQAENLMLCHENEKGIFGYNAENCLKLMRQVPSLRAVFDPANFVQCRVNTLYAWHLLKEHVEYLHAKDAKTDGKVVACGAGAGFVPVIVEEYLKRGGEMITLEPHLFSFSALKTLEENPEARNEFALADDAFDTAATALKKIIC